MDDWRNHGDNPKKLNNRLIGTNRFIILLMDNAGCHPEKYVLSKIDSCDTASDVVKSVNILSAIRWVSEAWSLVHSETISRYVGNSSNKGRKLFEFPKSEIVRMK